MAIFDRMRDRLRGRRAEEQVPEEQQGWGQMPTGSEGAWNGQERYPEDEPDIDRFTRTRTTEEDEAYAMGARMGAEGLMEMAGIAPKWTAGRMEAQRGMTRERLNKATETLMKYKSGKSSVDRRVIQAQQWWKLKNWEEIRKERGVKASTVHPSNTGWLWNCIVGKHADAIDSYPEPVILPRMMDDQEEAKKLSSIIPVVMEMNYFEETYNDCMW